MKLTVNGIERQNPMSLDECLGDFMKQLRGMYSSERLCISAIRVDGKELSAAQEAAFSLLPLSEVRTVEVFTSHPRELAEETLQGLREFTDHICKLSQASALLFQTAEHPTRELAKLIDGLETFVAALDQVKQVLHARSISRVQLLEADLHSVMKDILEAYQRNQTAYLVELLSTHLPRNMSEWKAEGIPALIRARDS